MKKRITQDTQINPLCHPRNPLFYKTNNSHTAANDIQQLIGDALLAGLVVLYRQFLNQIFRIVRRSLHGQHTGRMLRCHGVQQHRIYLLAKDHRQQFRQC